MLIGAGQAGSCVSHCLASIALIAHERGAGLAAAWAGLV